MKALDLPGTYVVTADDLSPEYAEAVLDAAVAAPADTACIELAGPGAVSCVQGLTTNDILGAGDGAFLYGAFLTPKGMIISDLWMSRFDDTVTLFVPARGRADIIELLVRSVPPRLASVEDTTSDSSVFRLAGPLSLERASLAGFAVPEPGRCIRCKIGPAEYLVSRPAEPGPFALQIHAGAVDADDVGLSLNEGGIMLAKTELLEVARVMSGWPRLGAEIDGKTLPQEVGFDRLAGVSYTKGCYTGQEVVARLHFRGHANKGLIGLSWEGDPDYRDQVISQNNAEVGRVTSLVWLDPIDQFVGLGIVKRSVNTNEPMVAAGAEAVAVELPFRFDS